MRRPCPALARSSLQRRKLSAVSAGVGTGLPIYVERAGGGILVDVDGNHLIDFGSGIAVTTVGNSAPRVVDSGAAQVERLHPHLFHGHAVRGYVEVAETLNRLTPGDHEKRTALFNSGAEAVENAVKIARTHTGRPAVVAFDHAYHGRTNLTMALTAKNMPYKQGFGPFARRDLPGADGLPLPLADWPERCAEEALDGARDHGARPGRRAQHRRRHHRADPGRGRVHRAARRVPRPGRRAGAREHGILFIADEIQTGFCRTGDWFACEHEGVVPDLITTAKGMAGGLPLAAVTGRAEVMDAVAPGGLGARTAATRSRARRHWRRSRPCRPRTSAAALARSRRLFMPRLRELAEKYDVIGDIRGRGAMLAVELVSGGGEKTPNPAVTSAVNAYCHSHGLVTLTAGTFGNVMRFLPPLSAGDDLLLEGLDILGQAFSANA